MEDPVTRRSVAPLVLTVLLVSVLGGRLHAQALAAGEHRQEPAITFKSSVEVVTVTAAVRDGRGRVVRDLKSSDFEVIDAGDARELRDFYSGEAPISLAVLLDISGSMAVGGNMDRARHAVALAMAHAERRRRRSGALHVRFEAAGSRLVHERRRPDQARQPRGKAVGHDVALRRHRARPRRASPSAPTGIARCSSSPTASTRAAG